MRPTSAIAAMFAAFLALATVTVPSVAADSSSVECGQVTGFVAPVPGGPSDGSLQLGFGDPVVILADATVSSEVASALPGLVNAGPTCVAVDLDNDGSITSIDFAATGSISGPVGFDPDTGFYIFAGRLIVPTFVTDAEPGLAMLFVASYQAGNDLIIAFSVDGISGQFVGFDGTHEFCGMGSLNDDGDGQVGDVFLPGSMLDAADIEALEGAGDLETCATVRSIGSIDPSGGGIASTTGIVITVATPEPTPTPDASSAPGGTTAPTTQPTLPPTSTDATTPSERDPGGSVLVLMSLSAAMAAALATIRRLSPVRRGTR